MIDQGHDRLGLDTGLVRWWLYISVQDKFSAGGDVETFTFARGGVAGDVPAARAALASAKEQAVEERKMYARRPTHLLGRRGELIPLGGQIAGDLERG